MATNVEELCKKMTTERIKRLLEGLQGLDEEQYIEKSSEPEVNKEKMASYADVVSDKQKHSETTGDTTDENITEGIINRIPSESVKPIFLKDLDFFGGTTPPRTQWLTNVEIYKAIGAKVPAGCIKGIQRVREMWRIYMDNEEDKLSLLVQGIHLRGRQVPLHSQNPHNPGRLRPNTIRIKVKNVPISADDDQIERALTIHGCDIQGIFRERLRVDSRLTNCETGDRIIISRTLKKPIPRTLQIGKYIATVFHSGQPEFENRNKSDASQKLCHKCLQPNHIIQNCPNEWVCKTCHKSGHKMMDCTEDIQTHETEDAKDNTSSDEEDDKSETETDDIQTDNIEVNDQETNGEKQETHTKKAKGKKKKKKETSDSDKTQTSIDKFMNTPASGNSSKQMIEHTPPTPTDILHDKTAGGNKKQKNQSNNKYWK